ncbi:unnamed protein product, partial [Phaeothamnion confervicola]
FGRTRHCNGFTAKLRRMLGEAYCWGPKDHELRSITKARGQLLISAFGGGVVTEGGLVWAAGECDGKTPLPNAQQAACGDDFTIALVGTGKKASVFSWGHAPQTQGELGLGARHVNIPAPTRIAALDGHRVTQIACGGAHCAAVTECGDLFTWGRGFEGQLGHTTKFGPLPTVQMLPKPVQAFLPTKDRQRPVRAVACGRNFTVAVTCAGALYSWGEGGSGQTGRGHVTSSPSPGVVLENCPETGEPFVQATCGWAHALARTEGGVVYAWGLNVFGQLGLGDRKTRHHPKRLRIPPAGPPDAAAGGGAGIGAVSDAAAGKETENVAAGGNASGAVRSNGAVYTWGYRAAGLRSPTRDSGGDDGSDGAATGEKDAEEHADTPRLAVALLGKLVADISLNGGGGGVLTVPSRVLSLEPPMGPRSGGNVVAVRGCGFWPSEDTVVRFRQAAADDHPAVARAVVGTWTRGSPRGVPDAILCKAPKFA